MPDAADRIQEEGRRPARPLGRAFSRLARAVARRPARVAGIAFAGMVAFGFLFNALVLQVGRHPAPLFAEPAPATGPDAKTAGETTGAAGAARAPAPPAAVPLPPSDPIAGLIRQSSGSDPLREVLFVQRALTKLGYGPLKPDGVYGPGTRQALERWEKDRGLPPRGEITRKLVQDLAAASGLPAE